MKNQKIKDRILKPSFSNLILLFSKGYTLRELIVNFYSLKIYSFLRSIILHKFYARGSGVDIDYRAVINGSQFIKCGDAVYVQRGAWLSVPLFEIGAVKKRPYLEIGNNCRIGPNCTISAAENIKIGNGVLLGPNVMIVDHRHAYCDTNTSISEQGIEIAGTITIEDNCWLGTNAVIYPSEKYLVLGMGCVVAANSFVRKSVPPYTLVSGNPARAIKHYDKSTGVWINVNNEN